MKLRKYSWWRIRGVPERQREGRGGDDLMMEAFKETLQGDRCWNKTLDFVTHMTRVMGSIASHLKTRAKYDEARPAVLFRRNREDGSEVDPLERIGAQRPSPAHEAIIKDMFSDVEKLFEKDAKNSLVLQGMRDGCSTAEIAECLETTMNDVEARKKLIGRHVRGAYPEGMGL